MWTEGGGDQTVDSMTTRPTNHDPQTLYVHILYMSIYIYAYIQYMYTCVCVCVSKLARQIKTLYFSIAVC